MWKASVLVLALAAQASAPFDVSSLAVAPPKLVCELDMSLLKGDVRRLAWAADGSSLYVQTLEGAALRDFIVTLPEGDVSVAFGEPEWAERYWAIKSDLGAPGFPELRIEVLEDHQRTRPTPFTGGFTPNGGQAIDPRNPVDTYAIEVKLKLLGEEIGYFLNNVAMAGVTYGWGPAGSGAIAFADDKGRIVLLDRDKHKRVVAGTKDALLPAWSNDGTRVAFIQKAGRRKYRLMTAAVTRPRT